MKHTSLLRDLVGFGLGGFVAAIIAGLSLVIIYPISPNAPGIPNYDMTALVMTAAIAFLCGGSIGQRAFSADFWSDLWPSVVTSYAVMGFLWLITGADFGEAGPMIGFVSTGIVASIVTLSFLGHRYPPKTNDYDA